MSVNTCQFKMKIAFIHNDDVNDQQNWSGISYYVHHSLKNKFSDISVLAPLLVKNNNFFKLLFTIPERIQRKITGNVGYSFYSVYILKKYGKLIDDFIKTNKPDVVISTTGYPFAYITFTQPLVLIGDATVKLLYFDYSDGKGWTKKYYRHLNQMAMKASNHASLIVSSSSYCTNSLIHDYNFPEERIATIPFGANMHEEDIFFKQREINKNERINFLFVGKDWERKGGDKAIAICDYLSAIGIDIRLTVVGSDVPQNSKRNYIVNYGFLNKNKPDEYEKLISCFKEAHFFMLFSKAEMYGIVFCEAAAMGLPVITSAVGGIIDIVVNNETGIILPKNTSAEDYAKNILELISNTNAYTQMSVNARKRYESLLNWTVFTDNLVSKMISLTEKNN